jgi:hypothetical protein
VEDCVLVKADAEEVAIAESPKGMKGHSTDEEGEEELEADKVIEDAMLDGHWLQFLTRPVIDSIMSTFRAEPILAVR